MNPVLSAGGSGASTPQGAEGDYGDNARLFDLLSQQLSNSAKTTSKVVDTLSRTLQQFSDPWSKFSAKGRFLSKEYVPSDVVPSAEQVSAEQLVDAARSFGSGLVDQRYIDYTPPVYTLTPNQERILLGALQAAGLGFAGASAPVAKVGNRLLGMGFGTSSARGVLRLLNPHRQFLIPDQYHGNFYN